MIHSTFRCLCIIGFCAHIFFSAKAQINEPARPDDPCGLPDTAAIAFRIAARGNWGYGYDSLKADLGRWERSPFVRVDSVGVSAQKRVLYVLTIEDTARPALRERKRVWIHARTHPNEVQGTWVTNMMIAILLSDTELGKRLRDSCVFNVMPMYNPDGVELGYPRENAHGVDIESNWAAIPGEPEVQVLRSVFTRLMAQPNPVRIALNMHSSTSCKRYFVYHAASGTSIPYASMEQKFIDLVRAHFAGGFEPYNYFVSWSGSAATSYPESWFWYNYHEAVLALTYEDMNCTAAGEYAITAGAILQGVGDYLGVTSGVNSVAESERVPGQFELYQNYPNPFNPTTNIGYRIADLGLVTFKVYDVLGREVATLVNEVKLPGGYEVSFNAQGLASGVYFYRLRSGEFTETRRLMLLR